MLRVLAAHGRLIELQGAALPPQAAHALLKVLRPHARDSLHDRSPRVRAAFVKLLLRVNKLGLCELRCLKSISGAKVQEL